MGKAAMCIKMLQILNSGRIYKVSELADLLETNPRNVIEYKKELDEAGYYIISIPGKYGGYQIDKTTIIPSLKFTEEEKKAISDGAGYLEARNDFLLKKDFTLILICLKKLTIIAQIFLRISNNLETIFETKPFLFVLSSIYLVILFRISSFLLTFSMCNIAKAFHTTCAK